MFKLFTYVIVIVLYGFKVQQAWRLIGTVTVLYLIGLLVIADSQGIQLVRITHRDGGVSAAAPGRIQ